MKFVFCSQWFFAVFSCIRYAGYMICSLLVPTKDRINLSVGTASFYLSSALPRPNYHISKLFFFFGVINDVVNIPYNSAVYRPYTPKTTCTYKQSTIVPVQAVKSYRRSRGIVLLVLNRCAWWRSASRYGRFTPEKNLGMHEVKVKF